ncbi:MAG: ABC transporter substrate-binding protein [Acidimicrobiales bacterium]
MSTFRRLVVAPALAALLLLLAACGTTEEADSGSATTDPTGSDEGSGTDATGPITVVDARGEEVTLDAPATDVVALEWMQAEVLVTLGVMPVGVADVEGYTTWVGAAAPLDDGVADVGTRAEPSLEAVIDLSPDLVIMEAGASDDQIAQVEQYAPVLVIQGSDASGNLDHMRANVATIATAVGRDAEAEEVLADLDAALADATAALADAGVAGDGFAMADGWMQGSAVSIRMFGEGSLMSDLAEAVGLDNQWDGEVDPMWGLGTTDVEGLVGLGDLHFFYSASGEDDVFAGALATNPIWSALPFAEAGQVHKLQSGTWTFGGPASAELFVDQIVAALAP